MAKRIFMAELRVKVYMPNTKDGHLVDTVAIQVESFTHLAETLISDLAKQMKRDKELNEAVEVEVLI